MSRVEPAPLPEGALLARYRARGDYTDGYQVTVAHPVSLPEFMAAFYTTPVFKLERWLLTHLARMPSTDAEANALAQGQIARFAAWQVEARETDQALLAAGRTRSWLMVLPRSDGTGTTLCFGSAVVQRRHGGMGWPFRVLLGVHKLYSRILLADAARRLTSAS